MDIVGLRIKATIYWLLAALLFVYLRAAFYAVFLAWGILALFRYADTCDLTRKNVILAMLIVIMSLILIFQNVMLYHIVSFAGYAKFLHYLWELITDEKWKFEGLGYTDPETLEVNELHQHIHGLDVYYVSFSDKILDEFVSHRIFLPRGCYELDRGRVDFKAETFRQFVNTAEYHFPDLKDYLENLRNRDDYREFRVTRH